MLGFPISAGRTGDRRRAGNTIRSEIVDSADGALRHPANCKRPGRPQSPTPDKPATRGATSVKPRLGPNPGKPILAPASLSTHDICDCVIMSFRFTGKSLPGCGEGAKRQPIYRIPDVRTGCSLLWWQRAALSVSAA